MSCALTALSLQQWVRPRATLSRDSLPEQVRSAALFATRIERCRELVEGLHALKFLSLHLFFIGLLFFFRAVSRPIFHTALVWAVFFLMFHVYQKCTVFLRSGCPSYTLQHYHSNDSIPTNLETLLLSTTTTTLSCLVHPRPKHLRDCMTNPRASETHHH